MAQGPIETPDPQGKSYPFDWSRIERWRPEATKAADEFGVPIERILAHVCIESGGDPRAFQRNEANGDSYGLMQIVPFGVGWKGWYKRFLDLDPDRSGGFDAYDPLLNLRVGASILRDFYTAHGSWDAASSCFFTGKPGWTGQDTVNGNTGANYKRTLDGLIAELAAARSPQPTPGKPTGKQVADAALRQAGKPYRWGAKGPDAFDCAGLVHYACATLSVPVPPSSYEQYKLGEAVTGPRTGAAGVLYFWDTENNGTAGHVAIGAGDGKVVHALNPQRGVVVSGIDADMGGPYLGARMIPGVEYGVIPTPAPKPLAFGNVPSPAVENRIIQHNTAWDDLGVRLNRGVVLHRMIGTLRGTDSYFRGEAASRALTDYGMGTAGTDGTADDGKILVWNDPRGRRSPWASGPVSQPYGDGAAFVKKYGSAAVNRDLRSIEISGIAYDHAVSERCWAAVAAITAYWADQAKIPWHQFPIHPETGISFVFWHQEFTIGTGKVCPGRVVMDGTTALIERVRGILKEAQTGEAATPEPRPSDPLEIMHWPLSHVRKAFPDYSPGQPVSKEYKRHCLEMGALPRFTAVWAAGQTWKKAWEFSDGWYVFQMNDGSIVASDQL